MKKKTTIITTGIILILLLGLACLLFSPLFRSGFPVTDDGDWMVIRLSAFYQSLREGQFPVRFLGRLYHGYGYPVANFLYPGFMYIGSILHAAGLPFTVTVKSIFILGIVVGAYAVYGWLRTFFRPWASGIGAMSFLLMPYLMYDVQKRGSVGEVLAMGVMMVALYAFDRKRRILFPFAVALLAISHNTLGVIFLAILCCYILLRHSWEYMVFFILGVGMSSFFWIPALFERSIVQFDTIGISDPFQYMKISQMLALESIPMVLAAVITFFSGKKTVFPEKRLFFWILMISLFLATQLSSFLWHAPVFSTFVQFPYRFLAVTCILGPWFMGFLADRSDKKIFGIFSGVSMIFLIVVAVHGHTDNRVIRPETYYTTNEDTTTTHNEYLPVWATKQITEHAATRLVFVSGDGKIEEKRVNTQTIEAVLHTRERSTLQINMIDYPGWGAMLDDHPIRILHTNEYGLMQIMIPPGTHHLFMEFRETAGRFITDVVSAICFILTVVAFAYYRHHGKQDRKKTKPRKS